MFVQLDFTLPSAHTQFVVPQQANLSLPIAYNTLWTMTFQAVIGQHPC